MTQNEELKVLFPNVDIVLSTGETVTLKPFNFGQIPRVVELATPLISVVQDLASDQNTNHEAIAIRLITIGGEDLIKILMFGLKKPREWFDDLPTDDGVALTTQFLAVNYDFFTQRVFPVAKKAMEKFRATTPA